MFKSKAGGAPASETAYQKGVWAEEIAAEHLQVSGYQILEMRYKTRYGEIDIIARRGDLIVFAEVKARGSVEEALYAVTPKTRRRVEQAALHYMSENEEIGGCDLRFDVVAISPSGANPSEEILSKDGNISVQHLDNAWMVGA